MDLSQLTLRDKIGQMFFIGIPGAEYDEQTRELIDEIKPGGICLFARNIKTPEQTRRLLDSLVDALPVLPALSLDQEGGLVDRLRRLLEPMPPASAFYDDQDVREFAAIIAEAIRILGFNMNFAPVVDVLTADRADTNNGLYSRIFGRDKEDTTELAGSFLTALQENGVVGCLKHFPGLGAAPVDSHEELPTIEISGYELHSTDLQPYRTLFSSARVHAVMTAHAVYPNTTLLDRDEGGRLFPSSLSQSAVSDLL